MYCLRQQLCIGKCVLPKTTAVYKGSVYCLRQQLCTREVCSDVQSAVHTGTVCGVRVNMSAFPARCMSVMEERGGGGVGDGEGGVL